MVAQLFVVGQQFDMFFLELFDVFGQFVAGGRAGGSKRVFLQHVDAGLDFAGQGHNVFGAQTGERAFVVAMQINQSLKSALFATGKEPVDRAFFVGFDVVGDEFGQEVAADAFAGGLTWFEFEGGGDEVEVFGEGVGAVGDFDEFDEAADDIVVEVGGVGNGEDTIVSGGEGVMAAGIEGLSGVD